MYANVKTATTLPLSAALAAEPSVPRPRHRRRRIGSYRPDARQLETFNRLLQRLGRSDTLDCDRLATAARRLRAPASSIPACIAERLRQAETLAWLAADPAWEPAAEAVSPLRTVLAYLEGDNDLIPDSVPEFGRFDDAIVVESAWPRLAGEVEAYLDFCRVREVEARLRGCGILQFRFDRDDWEVARRAEAALVAHQRQVREHRYTPQWQPLFRVH